MSDFDSINAEQRLYVKREAGGYSCLGFEVAERWLQDVLAWLPAECRPIRKPEESVIPSRAHYEYYRAVMTVGARHAAATNTRCPAQLTPQLVGKEGRRVEVQFQDGTKSRFWVGKSSGWLPIHLEIKTSRSIGGGAAYVPQGATVRVVR